MKKYVVALMLAVSFGIAFYAVRVFNKNNETAVLDVHYTWHVELDSAGAADMMVRGRKIGSIKQDVHKLVAALNTAVVDGEIKRTQGEAVSTDVPRITLQKVEQQVANIEIANDRYLTQKMGSSGAQDYLAEVTYTLTENPGIRQVNFIFSAGDHAVPGLYSRESFAAYKLVSEDDSRKKLQQGQ